MGVPDKGGSGGGQVGQRLERQLIPKFVAS